jgi:phosphatidylserine/phosphatidylglycerophosphate/cardiolipin synthase-like enzyme
LGSWVDRGGIYSYSHIWILTLKRIYAEGLQQRTWEKIDIRKKEPMKGITALLAIFTFTFCIFSPLPVSPQEKPVASNWEVYFSPLGGCTEAIIRELGKAKTSVLVQAYLFSSEPIAKALLDTHKKGMKVEVTLDKSQKTEKYSVADFFANSGIPTKIDSAHNIAHNKIIIIHYGRDYGVIQLYQECRRKEC